jgi:DNA-binding NarL/FixJ family response regulator
MPVRVVLVEDHEIVRHGLKVLLDGDPQVSVIGEASNGAEALKKLDSIKPDLLVMDMNMPVMNGLECTRLVKKQYPDIKVLILSMLDHESYLIDMLDAGADGYILKNSSREELIFAIKKIANGGMYIGPEFTLSMLAKYKREIGMNGKTPPDIDLTERERDVLDLVAEGLTNVEIASKLFTSVRTIETRRKKLLEKTGTTNTATLIRFAVLNGLIK